MHNSDGSYIDGSSPRTRGTDAAARPDLDGSRFIPAHAGNRSMPMRARSSSPVHPRARGEQSFAGGMPSSACGSSPRTRGTGTTGFRRRTPSRFIPAHAGNSRPFKRVQCAASVHPRARGEQVVRAAGHGPQHGSSPRTRGTEQQQQGGGGCFRFIPAHAGNRVSWSNGEPTVGGSSPRTRGTVVERREWRERLRFIPAHAGNSRRFADVSDVAAVHPRARGEQAHRVWQQAAGIGSSPRTRGTGRKVQRSFAQLRFIPAHAGNSTQRNGVPGGWTVHPRARGEQRHPARRAPRPDGSSPRTRGTGFAG